MESRFQQFSADDRSPSVTSQHRSPAPTAVDAFPTRNLVQRSDVECQGEPIRTCFSQVDEEVAFRATRDDERVTAASRRSSPGIIGQQASFADYWSPVFGRGYQAGRDVECGVQFETDVPTRRILQLQGRTPEVGNLRTTGQLESVTVCRSPSVTSVGQRALAGADCQRALTDPGDRR